MTVKSARDIAAEAARNVETLTGKEAVKLKGDPNVVFVDVREAAELRRTGKLVGAVHAPRGVLEFQVDPTSPTHNPALAAGRKLILYCGSGSRSALAAKALVDMGHTDIAHVAGGFPALQDAGAGQQPFEAE